MKDSTVNKISLKAWCVSAWDRTILAPPVTGRPLVFCRTEDEGPIALADACSHRLTPRSPGKFV